VSQVAENVVVDFQMPKMHDGIALFPVWLSNAAFKVVVHEKSAAAAAKIRGDARRKQRCRFESTLIQIH
jgi:hypothetical protein